MSEDGTGSASRVGRAGGVISLASRRAPGRFGALEDVRRYWEALRGDRVVPMRSEIDPRGIDGALDTAFILERIAPGIARFRLAGSALVDLMGAEVRGMPLSVMFNAESRPGLSAAVERVFSGPETLRLTLSGERGLGRPPLVGQMLVLPLKSDLGDVSRALGCMAVEGDIGRSPRRLVIRDVEHVDALSGRRTVADRESDGARSGPAPGSVLRPVPGAPHLRVVQAAE